MNILFLFDIHSFSNPIVQNNSNIDMDIDILRGRSVSLSTNSSRESLTYLNLSSISYHERMEDLSNKLS